MIYGYSYIDADIDRSYTTVALLIIGQTFVGRLVMHHEYKDRHKTHYASGQTFTS